MEDQITVVARIRPTNTKELGNGNKVCVNVPPLQDTTLQLNLVNNGKYESKAFSFDYVASDSVSQHEFFSRVGLPAAETCLAGYNATIIAYGQTGTGKTFSVFGGEKDADKGLVPRLLQHIFKSLKSSPEGVDNKKESRTYSAKCSFYEIYQEKVYDLLSVVTNEGTGGAGGLLVREDNRRGVFVEGVTEEPVSCPEDASRILKLGYNNRHVGETNMNRESSRSHAVFQLSLEVNEDQLNGVRVTRSSRFTLVDLAGSERQKDAQTSGERLKEAGQINKSLSALGNVINALSVETSNRPRHVHYRDSKLTFLLRDSLGGNSKTVLIGTISPAESCIAETLSTLQFAKRAKNITNRVVLNEESTGTFAALQQEILALRSRLQALESAKNQSSASFTGEQTSDGRISLGRYSLGKTSGSSPLKFPPSSPSLFTSLSLSLTTNSSADNNHDAINLATNSMSMMTLLSQAMERSHHADELRLRAELKNRALNQRLEQAEKAAMGMKMKLKMRDAEIAKYRNKGASSEMPSDANVNPDEAIRVEVNAVREEMQVEVLKYRLAAEELERRMRSMASTVESSVADKASTNCNGTYNFVWNEEREDLFNHSLLEQVKAAEKSAENISKSIDTLKSKKFEDIFGFTLSEAHSLQSKAEDALKRYDLAEAKSSTLAAAMINLQEKNSALLSQLATSQKDHEIQLASSATCIEDLQAAIVSLQNEIQNKEEIMKNKLGNMQRSGDEAILALQAKEADLKSKEESFHKAMKDNTLLLKMKKDLDIKVESLEAKLLLKEDEISSLQAKHLDETIKFEEQLSHVRDQLIEKENALATAFEKAFEMESRLSEISSYADELEQSNKEKMEALDGLNMELSQVQRDLQLNIFENQRSKEEIDNILIQQESHLARCNELQEALQVANSTLSEKCLEIESHQSKINELLIMLNDRESEGQRLIETMAEVSSLKKEIEATKSHLETVIFEKEEADQRCKSLQVEIVELNNANSSLFATLRSAREEITDLSSKLNEMCACNDEKTLEIVDLRHLNAENIEKEEAALERISQLQSEITKLSDMVTSVQSNLRTLEIEKEEAVNLWKSKWADANEKCNKNATQLAEMQAENARLCGHQNAKQKIQLHMNLKKDIDVQAAIVKQQQETILSLTLERDNAVAEARKLRSLVAADSEKTIPGGYSSIVATVKAKRLPLKDSNNNRGVSNNPTLTDNV